ncbi:MAG TPA: DUF2066 domain-containing protein [Steroidobacteraceae bacterium]|nr:DUF2066 domain-containing protein [Steroidobacteraceae bacterium]
MAQFFSNTYRQYLRPAVIVCLLAAAGLPAGVFGLTRVDLFQAQAPVDGRSEAAQTAAFQAAMRVVLVRVTGRRTADEDAVFAPLVNNARRYVQQFRTTPDNQLWVSFDAAAIERWLTQNGQPLWGRERPSTLVWLSVPGPQSNAVVSAEDSSELKDAVDGAALLRGIPLVWPPAAAANAASNTPADVAHRLGAEGVLIGRANGTAASAAVRWTLQFQDRSLEFSGALDGVNRTADLYAELFAASGTLAPVDIEVSGVDDLREYANVQSYLESFNFITHVGVLGLSADTVRFRLTTRGGIETLTHALSLNGKLQPLPAGDNGLHRFHLRR